MRGIRCVLRAMVAREGCVEKRIDTLRISPICLLSAPAPFFPTNSRALDCVGNEARPIVSRRGGLSTTFKSHGTVPWKSGTNYRGYADLFRYDGLGTMVKRWKRERKNDWFILARTHSFGTISFGFGFDPPAPARPFRFFFGTREARNKRERSAVGGVMGIVMYIDEEALV